MPPTDAAQLVNWFPKPTSVVVRPGAALRTTNLSGRIETLMVYSGPTTNKMFACSSSGIIYDTTTPDEFLGTEGGSLITTEAGTDIVVTVGGSIIDYSGLANGRFQYVNITTSGGSYIRAVNGADKSVVFDGTSWHQDGDGAPYNITGVDTADCIQINMHQGRMWLIENNSLKTWYLATGALGGAVTAFDLTSIARKGGYCMAMATWTIDAGYGLDDFAVFITSNGEVIVYKGTDPADATKWSLVGIYEMGSPVGRRCFIKYAGDLLIISQDGVVPMSGALQSSRTNPRVALTDKIMSAVSQAVTLYGSNFGWQLNWHPKENELTLNVPVDETGAQEQYVMNNITKSWGRFQGWAASCWCIFENDAYFGTDGNIYKAWEGYSDAGTEIEASASQAYTTMKTPLNKRVVMMQPFLQSNGSPDVSVGVNVDYATNAEVGTLTTQTIPYGLWDSATWDSSIFAPDTVVLDNWQDITGEGKAFGTVVNASVNGQRLEWVSTSLVYEVGGIL
jgi:hypothetical protein